MLKPLALGCTACLLLGAVPVVSARQPSPPPLHVLKIAAGPDGVEEGGTFRLSEERSRFSRTDHREVIVVFQWEGTPGRHLIEAVWRSPDGASSSRSTLDYTAKDRRFGAVWRFPIAPAMPLGMWAIEATVDGQPGGRFTFEITDAAATPAPPVKRPLTQQELYDQLSKIFVVLSRFQPGARLLGPGGGVIADRGQLFTAVSLLDNLERVTAILGGTSHELVTVIDMNRSTGWAILAAPAVILPTPARAAERPRVGDRCYSMRGTETGARVLLEGQVTGATGDPQQASAGWVVTFANGVGLDGAPVVNEFGELFGMIGRSAAPEPRRARGADSTVDFGSTPVIPIGEITPRAGTPPAAFDALRKRGDLLRPLAGEEHVLSGGFASKITSGPVVALENQRTEFSAREKEFVAFVTWSPRARLRGQTTFHLFDAANRLMMSTRPAKVNFRQNELVMSTLKLAMLKQPGIYRIELHFDGRPVWREYVQITP